jgi:GNAT superfamily N-acetyltransferase
MKVKIRKARKSDSSRIIELIKELAKFEKLNPPDNKGTKRLLKDAFSKNPRFKILVSEYGNKLTGYAFYFFTYSTFLAKPTLYLEDIYISEDFRSKGIGKIFLKELLKIARKEKCGRMELIVLDWNVNAIKFYEKLGAKHMANWNFFRMEI